MRGRKAHWMFRRKAKGPSHRKAYASIALVVIIVVATYAFYPRPSGPKPVGYEIGAVVPTTFYSELSRIAVGPYGALNSSYTADIAVLTTNTTYTLYGKPIVLYIGGDFCGLCGSLRWPLVLALMRFGNFTQLSLTSSASPDQYPNVDSFSFAGSVYTSQWIAFQPYELWNRAGDQRASLPSNYSLAWSQVNDSIPYLSFADEYQLLGTYSPASLQNLSWTQIASMIQTGSGAGPVIRQVANAITALICAVDGEQPDTVCANPTIANFIVPTGQF